MEEEITTGMPIDLLLVRHGHSEGNRALESAEDGDVRLHQDRRYRARSAADYRLTAEGRAQAATAGVWLRSWLDHEGLEGFDRWYCSPFVRTRETAALLGIDTAQWQLESLLRERDFGLWEGLSKDVAAEMHARSNQMKKRYKFLWRPEAGESTADLDLRVREVLATLAREMSGKRVICVTHEDTMRAFRFRLEKMTIEQWNRQGSSNRLDIVNCGILHYTRRDSSGTVRERFERVRTIDPSRPDEARWRRIRRPRFSNEDLLAQVGRHPHLWDDDDVG